MTKQNPTDTTAPFDFVLFGGTGDLAMRKLLPSLYYHHCDGLLAESGITFAFSGDDLLEQARFAHRHGLSRDQALAAMTATPVRSNPARE